MFREFVKLRQRRNIAIHGINRFNRDPALTFRIFQRILERIETTSRKQERNNAGLLVMMQATVGRFEERVTSLETEILRLKEAE